MDYLLVKWKHDHPDEPVVLYSELDEARMERRKIDIFPTAGGGYVHPPLLTPRGFEAVPNVRRWVRARRYATCSR